MNQALSLQHAGISEGHKLSLRQRLFNKSSMLRTVKAVLPVAAVAAFFPDVALATTTGTDLMKSGDATVKSTFGKSSSVVIEPTGFSTPQGCSGLHDQTTDKASSLPRSGLRSPTLML